MLTQLRVLLYFNSAYFFLSHEVFNLAEIFSEWISILLENFCIQRNKEYKKNYLIIEFNGWIYDCSWKSNIKYHKNDWKKVLKKIHALKGANSLQPTKIYSTLWTFGSLIAGNFRVLSQLLFLWVVAIWIHLSQHPIDLKIHGLYRPITNIIFNSFSFIFNSFAIDVRAGF